MLEIPLGAYFDDLADAIANPDPSRPARNWIGGKGRAVCDGISSGAPWARTPGGAVAKMSGICKPYWDDKGYSPPQLQPPPFPGGQCVGGQYRVNWSYRTGPCSNPTVNDNVQPAVFVTGPVTRSISEVQISATAKRVEFYINGVLRAQVNVGLNCTVNPSALAGGTWGTFVPTRLDGPDNCGSLPPTFGPGPNPAPDPGPIPPDQQPKDDPITGPVLPIPDLPGLPGLPDIPIRNPFAPPGADPAVPGDPGEPGPSVDTGPGGDVEGDAPTGSELVALRVDIESSPPYRAPLRDGVFQAVCFAYMGTVAGLDQDPGGAYLRDGQLMYAEQPGLTKWRVSANVGYSLRITPFYREVN